MTVPLLLAEQLLAEYAERFMNRAFPYAVQQPDGTYRWRYETCTAQLLAAQLLAAHLLGELTLAFSSTDTDGSCRWVCLDIDEAASDARTKLLALRTALAGVGLPGLVEASRRGGHLWLMLDRPLPSAQARAAVFAALDGLHAHEIEISRFELYPDTAAPEVLGHAVRVPLGLHQLTGRRYALTATRAPSRRRRRPCASYCAIHTSPPRWSPSGQHTTIPLLMLGAKREHQCPRQSLEHRRAPCPRSGHAQQ